MTMILDAGKGEIFLEPDETMVALYKEKAEKFEAFQKELEELSTLPSETKDGPWLYAVCKCRKY